MCRELWDLALSDGRQLCCRYRNPRRNCSNRPCVPVSAVYSGHCTNYPTRVQEARTFCTNYARPGSKDVLWLSILYSRSPLFEVFLGRCSKRRRKFHLFVKKKEIRPANNKKKCPTLRIRIRGVPFSPLSGFGTNKLGMNKFLPDPGSWIQPIFLESLVSSNFWVLST